MFFIKWCCWLLQTAEMESLDGTQCWWSVLPGDEGRGYSRCLECCNCTVRGAVTGSAQQRHRGTTKTDHHCCLPASTEAVATDCKPRNTNIQPITLTRNLSHLNLILFIFFISILFFIWQRLVVINRQSVINHVYVISNDGEPIVLNCWLLMFRT